MLLTVWSLLAAAPLWEPWLGRSGAALGSFAAAAALLLATRRPWVERPSRPVALVLGLAAGYASFPAWLAAAFIVGSLVGLAPIPPVLAGAGDPLAWLASLVLAPVFEELLYRERLLAALRPRLGAPAAVLVTSALFAMPHYEPWHVVGTFLVGLGLGTVMRLGGSVGLCIAIHAGLNLASLAGGSPPTRLALPATVSAATGLMLCAVALTMQRARAGGVRTSRASFPSRAHALGARERGSLGPR